MSDLNLLHVFTDMGIGGTERVMYQISDFMLDEKGVTVTVASTDGPMEKKFLERGIKNFRVRNFKKKHKIFSNIKDLSGIIKKTNPNVIHTHSLYSLVLIFFISKYLNKKKFKIVHTGHGGPKKNYDRIARKLVWMTDRYIAISEYSYSNLIERSKSSKVKLIRNGVDLPSQDEKSLGDVTEKPLKISFIGRLTKQKGLIYLLEAVKEMVSINKKKVHLKIVGDGDLKNELEEYVKIHNLETYITFLGYQEKPWQMVADSQVIVMPSIWENGGLVAMEAIVRDYTVVASKIQGLKDTISDCYNGYYITPSDSSSIVRVITDIYEGKKELIQLSTKEKSKYVFNESTGPKLKKLYLELTKEG